MSYSISNSWYYAIDSQRQGPVSFQELQARVADGEVTPAALVWSEGMPDWMEAGQVAELFPRAAAASQTAYSGDTAMAGDGGVQHGQQAQYQPQPYPQQHYQQPYQQKPQGNHHAGATEHRVPHVRPANFWLWLGLGVAGCVVYMAALFIVGMYAEEGSDQNIPIAAIVLGLVGFAALMASLVLGHMYLYRAWVLVQDAHLPARTTPGKAVGFLFIPFFNFYWMFVAVSGWAQDYNRMISAYEYRDAPRINEGLFLSLPILVLVSIVPFVGALASLATLVVGTIVIFQICQAINHFAASPVGGRQQR